MGNLQSSHLRKLAQTINDSMVNTLYSRLNHIPYRYQTSAIINLYLGSDQCSWKSYRYLQSEDLTDIMNQLSNSSISDEPLRVAADILSSEAILTILSGLKDLIKDTLTTALSQPEIEKTVSIILAHTPEDITISEIIDLIVMNINYPYLINLLLHNCFNPHKGIILCGNYYSETKFEFEDTDIQIKAIAYCLTNAIFNSLNIPLPLTSQSYPRLGSLESLIQETDNSISSALPAPSSSAPSELAPSLSSLNYSRYITLISVVVIVALLVYSWRRKS